MPDKKRREMPSRDQLRIWRDYLETTEELNAQLAARMQQQSALSMGDYKVLLELSEATGQRLRSSEAAEKIGWERSRLSHHLGRMEKRGLIRRQAYSDDSRGSEVILTELGADAFRRSSVPHLQDIHDLFLAALTPSQLVAVADAMGAVKQHLELVFGKTV